MLDVPNLLALSQQIGTLPTQLPRVFSLECSFSFMLPWWWSLYPAVCQSYCVSLLPITLLFPLLFSFFFSFSFFPLSLPFASLPLHQALGLFLSLVFLAVPPRPPVIVGLERAEVRAGRVLLLKCVSHGGNPLASVHWTKVNLFLHLLRKLCDTMSHWQNNLFQRKTSPRTHTIWVYMGYTVCFFTPCFNKKNRILHIRMGRLCRQLGRRTSRSRGRPVFSSWRSLLQTTRWRFAARTSTWCHLFPSPSAPGSRCSVSKNHSTDQK